MVSRPKQAVPDFTPGDDVLRTLASTIHEHWRARSRTEGWSMQAHIDRPFADLAPDDQANNRAAAQRIGQVLAAARLGISRTGPSLPPDILTARMSASMEAMAEAEHEGWMAQRQSQGWIWGAERDDDRKLHPSIIPYDRLSEAEKEKDRANIRLYPALVTAAGLYIVDGAQSRDP